jgi:opacity protein-like surface antigen
MRMLNKRTLLASSALAVIASAGQAQAGDFYISVFGGANFEKSTSNSTQVFFLTGAADTVDPDTGFVLGGAIGVHLDKWLNGLRAEIEADYRRNKLEGHWSEGSAVFGPTGGPISGHSSTFALLANVWYDINIGQKWVPYIGGGAGWGRSTFDGALAQTFGTRLSSNTFHVENSGFVFQLGAGVNYPIQDGVNLGIGYRYFRGPSIKNNVFVGKGGGFPLAVNGENDNHSVMVNLTIDVD